MRGTLARTRSVLRPWAIGVFGGAITWIAVALVAAALLPLIARLGQPFLQWAGLLTLYCVTFVTAVGWARWAGASAMTRDGDVPVDLPLTVFQYGDCPIHYALLGPTNRPLVVFTHGAGLDHRTFAPQVAVVAEQYRVLVWDVRGHGRSRPAAREFSIAVAAQDLAALLDHVGCRQAILVGQSMGSYISQELAYRYPERAAAVVAIGATPITMRYPAWERLALRWSLPIFRIMPWEALKRMMAYHSAVQDEVRAYAYEAFRQLSQEEFYHIWVAVSRCLRENPEYRFAKPLLITHGAHDRVGTVRKHVPVWAEREPLGRYVVIPDAGHMANQDNPTFFNTILMDFLGSVN